MTAAGETDYFRNAAVRDGGRKMSEILPEKIKLVEHMHQKYRDMTTEPAGDQTLRVGIVLTLSF